MGSRLQQVWFHLRSNSSYASASCDFGKRPISWKRHSMVSVVKFSNWNASIIYKWTSIIQQNAAWMMLHHCQHEVNPFMNCFIKQLPNKNPATHLPPWNYHLLWDQAPGSVTLPLVEGWLQLLQRWAKSPVMRRTARGLAMDTVDGSERNPGKKQFFIENFRHFLEGFLGVSKCNLVVQDFFHQQISTV